MAASVSSSIANNASALHVCVQRCLDEWSFYRVFGAIGHRLWNPHRSKMWRKWGSNWLCLDELSVYRGFANLPVFRVPIVQKCGGSGAAIGNFELYLPFTIVWILRTGVSVCGHQSKKAVRVCAMPMHVEYGKTCVHV